MREVKGVVLALVAVGALQAAPSAGAAHCPSDTLIEAFGVTCVFECGAAYPAGVPAFSYCFSNNGRCPGSLDRAPDVPPYFTSCARDDAQVCDPPPATLRVLACNLV